MRFLNDGGKVAPKVKCTPFHPRAPSTFQYVLRSQRDCGDGMHRVAKCAPRSDNIPHYLLDCTCGFLLGLWESLKIPNPFFAKKTDLESSTHHPSTQRALPISVRQKDA